MTHATIVPTAKENRFMPIVASARGRLLVALGLASVLTLALLVPASGSSHREAPLISEDPVADNTDVYAFQSPDAPDTTTLISNWIPFQQPQSGPYFYNWGEDVLYEVNIDNDGDAVEDIVYEWRFTTQSVPYVDGTEEPQVPLYNINQITSLDDADWLYKQTYTLSVVNNGVRTVLGQDLPVPPYNVGAVSNPDYESVAQDAIVDLDTDAGTIRSFAGPRDDPFAVDIGSAFDLLLLRPLAGAHLSAGTASAGIDGLARNNIHSVALQIPTDALTEGDDPVIGVWSTTNRRKTTVFAAGNGAAPVASGPFVQVSRLGNPFVNELVIPTALKDTFNTLRPEQDAPTLAGLEAPPFATEGDIPLVTDPILSEIIEVVYPGVQTPAPPRADLVAIFLTGIPDLNAPASADAVPSEVLRLNTSIPATPFVDQDRLGLLAAQNDGFPNGRRLIDDITDIELRALAGGTPFTPEFNISPNNALTDGVPFNDIPLPTTFPYLASPHSGLDSQDKGDAVTTHPYGGATPEAP